ncbi:MAG: polyphenol oxidase family protein, partial [Spirochaetia bacterium]|nr:polyphenol oxidase family protein [Spirochaetia bacterium]
MTHAPARFFNGTFFTASVFGKKDLQNLEIFSDEETRRHKEKEFLSAHFGLKQNQIFFLKQEHGNRAFYISNESSEENQNLYYAAGDAMYTDSPETALCIRTADCMPVFFSAEKNQKRIIGLIHAGWRGLKNRIIPETLTAAADKFGMEPEHFSVFFGPSAGGGVYQVQEDVAGFFSIKTENPDHSYMLDLRANALLQLDNYHITEESFFDCTLT